MTAEPSDKARPGQPWVVVGRVGLVLGAANGVFQVVRDMSQTSTSLSQLTRDRVTTISLFSAAGVAVFFGISTWILGIRTRRGPYYDFAPDSRRIRRRLIRIGRWTTIGGLLMAIGFGVTYLAFRR